MDYVLPILMTLFVLIVVFRREIKRAARRWYGVEPVNARESLEEILETQRRKLRDQEKRNENSGAGSSETT